MILFIACSWLFHVSYATVTNGQYATPSLIDLALNKPITATSTCGQRTFGDHIDIFNEEFCLFERVNEYGNTQEHVTHGFTCFPCDSSNASTTHTANMMVDDDYNTFWQSPSLLRNLNHELVNITIDLKDVFYVQTISIKMANSPRPKFWKLLHSNDGGKTFEPWMGFAPDAYGCYEQGFGSNTDVKRDRNSIIMPKCDVRRTSATPLRDGEIIVNLLNENGFDETMRSSYKNVQEWLKSTHIRLQLLKLNDLLGVSLDGDGSSPRNRHTKQYFYSIRQVHVYGTCICNGHGYDCVEQYDQNMDKNIYKCICHHSTTGDHCESCMDGYVQKKWRPATTEMGFQCEKCNCHGHSNDCIYDEEIDNRGESLDLQRKYEGGGVCQNCMHNTAGVNCEKCTFGYYLPTDYEIHDEYGCRGCSCDRQPGFNGDCLDGEGACLCRPNFKLNGGNCDACADGFHDYPTCSACDCDFNGTQNQQCMKDEITPESPSCNCKAGYIGEKCDKCQVGFYNFPNCKECKCESLAGSSGSACDDKTGQCECKVGYVGHDCNSCAVGYYGYPDCKKCDCEVKGTHDQICDSDGKCQCRDGLEPTRCEACLPSYYGFPSCSKCECNESGSSGTACDPTTGNCQCKPHFAKRQCDICDVGYYAFPDCYACTCDLRGANGEACDDNGNCYCKTDFQGQICDKCAPNRFNYPLCEECTCDPNGISMEFAGCGHAQAGRLCDCKDNVEGRRCDTCKATFFGLTRDNIDGCEECGCNPVGSISGLNTCDPITGQCLCKEFVEGTKCDGCKTGYTNLTMENAHFGCQHCECDYGAIDSYCRENGECNCVSGMEGEKCSTVKNEHYVPNLIHMKYELEAANDGLTNGRSRMSSVSDQFPGFSGKGFLVCATFQKDIYLDVTATSNEFYSLGLRYRIPNGQYESGMSLGINITSIPLSRTNNVGTVDRLDRLDPAEIETGEIVFDLDSEEKYNKIKDRTGTAFATNHISGNNIFFNLKQSRRIFFSCTGDQEIYLDYFFLVPEFYTKPDNLKKEVTRVCKREKNVSPCLEYSFLSDMSVENDDQESYLISDSRVAKSYHELANLTLLDRVTPCNYKNCPYFITTDDGMARREGGKSWSLYKDEEDPAIGVCSNSINRDIGPAGLKPICTSKEAFKFESFGGNENELLQRVRPNLRQVFVPTGTKATYLPLVMMSVPEAASSFDVREGLKDRTTLFKVDNGDQFMPNKEGLSIPRIKNHFKHNNFTIVGELMVDNAKPHIILVEYDFPMTNLSTYDITIPITVEQDTGSVSKVTVNLTITQCASTRCRTLVNLPPHSYLSNSVRVTFNLSTVDVKDVDQFNIYKMWFLQQPEFNQYNIKPYLEQKGYIDGTEVLKKCLDDFYHAKYDPADKELCEQLISALSLKFNGEAPPCDCDTKGSDTLVCEKLGGQCKCKEGFAGRRCDECATGHFGTFPNCRKCNCQQPKQCDPENGCQCAKGSEGDQCDKCKGRSYGYHELIGCKLCACQPMGSDTMTCDAVSGQCNCKANIFGRRCTQCRAGFYRYPQCIECICDKNSGTSNEICNAMDGTCLCKRNVVGQMCNQCKYGFYNLDPTNADGCTECYCSGHSDSCSSAHNYISQDIMLDCDDWELEEDDCFYNLKRCEQRNHTSCYETNEVSAVIVGQKLRDNEQIYWKVPNTYLGNRVHYYGGQISFARRADINADATKGDTVKPNKKSPDIKLMGSLNDVDLDFYIDFDVERLSEDWVQIVVPLLPQYFRFGQMSAHEFGYGQPTREQFMDILHFLTQIQLKATNNDEQINEAFIANFTISQAVEVTRNINPDSPAYIEQCDRCEVGYAGTSCHECEAGYYRHLDTCFKCDCNEHSNDCDVNTGNCLNCKHNTKGEQCELCADKYNGDARFDPNRPHRNMETACGLCPCPYSQDANPDHVFANSCSEIRFYNDHDNNQIWASDQCTCDQGYSERDCSRCAIGYFGDPSRGEACMPCQCSGNNNAATSRYDCDQWNGQCFNCYNNTEGEHCDSCVVGFYGDAIVAKNCQKCKCQAVGTESCDTKTGECRCKENVMGKLCDQCTSTTWNYYSERGCEECRCGEGALGDSCDLKTGQCQCADGIGGQLCDQCKNGYWNFTMNGCEKCSCFNEFTVTGSVCNGVTGDCYCMAGAGGQNCDRCEDGYMKIPTKGCRICTSCVTALATDMTALAEVVDMLKDKMSGATTQHYLNNRLTSLKEECVELTGLHDDVIDMGKITIGESELAEPIDAVLEIRDGLNRNINYINGENKKFNEKLEKSRTESSDAMKDSDDVDKQLRELSEKVTKVNRIDGSKISAEGIDSLHERAKEMITGMESNTDTLDNVTRTLDDIKETIELTLAGVAKEKRPQLEFVNSTKNAIKNMEMLDLRVNDLKMQTISASDKNAKSNETLSKLSNHEVIKSVLMTVSDLEANVTEVTKNITDALGEHDEILKTFDLDVHNKTFVAVEMQLAELEMDPRVGVVETSDVEILVEAAKIHAKNLTRQTEILSDMFKSNADVSEGLSKATVLATLSEINTTVNGINNGLAMQEVDGKVVDNLYHKQDLLNKSVITLGDKNFDDGLPLLQTVQNGLQMLESDQKKNPIEKQENKIKEQMEHLANTKKNVDKNEASVQTFREKKYEDKKAEYSKQLDTLVQNIKNADQEVDDLMENQYDELRIKASSHASPEVVKGAFNNAAHSKNQSKNLLNEIVEDELLERTEELVKNQGSRLTDLMSSIDEAKRMLARLKFDLDNTNAIVETNKKQPLLLNNPSDLNDFKSYNNISFYFKATEPTGVLFYMGNMARETARKKREIASHEDYIMFQLVDGNPTLDMNAGDGACIIAAESIELNTHCHVRIVRVNEFGQLFVNCQDGKKTGGVCNVAHNAKTFDYDFGDTGHLFVGGLPEKFSTQSRSMVKGDRGFAGTISGLVLNDRRLGLFNKRNFMDQSYGEDDVKINFLISPKWTFDDRGYLPDVLGFDGTGYATLSRSRIRFARDSHKNTLEFTIRTFSRDALLLYYKGKEGDYVAVELKDGGIKATFSLGSPEPVECISNTPAAIGEWYTFKIKRTAQMTELDVSQDDEDTVDKLACSGGGSEYTELNKASDSVFLGGVPVGTMLPDGVSNSSFKGCMKTSLDQFEIKDGSVCSSEHGCITEHAGTRTGCIISTMERIISFHGDGSSALLTKIDETRNVQLSQMIGISFKFMSEQPDGLLLLLKAKKDAKDQREPDGGVVADFIKIELKDRTIVYTELGFEKTPMVLTSSNFSDRLWHHFSLRRTSLGINLAVDDINVKFIDYSDIMDEGEFATARHRRAHLNGGIIDDYLVDAELSFGSAMGSTQLIGCIGDVLVNLTLINFRQAKRDGAWSLSGCLNVKNTHRTSTVGAAAIGEPSTDTGGTEEHIKVKAETLWDTDGSSTCLLPRTADGPFDSDNVGDRFGHVMGEKSIKRFDNLALNGQQKAFNLTVSFRTVSPHGLIVHGYSEDLSSFISLYLLNGSLVYQFNVGGDEDPEKNKMIKAKYSMIDFTQNKDFKHHVTVIHTPTEVSMTVDHQLDAKVTVELERSDKIGSGLTSISVGAFDVTRFSELRVMFDRIMNRAAVFDSFYGCIYSIIIDNALLTTASSETNIQPCRKQITTGGSFYSGGDHQSQAIRQPEKNNKQLSMMKPGYSILNVIPGEGVNFAAVKSIVVHLTPRSSSGLLFVIGEELVRDAQPTGDTIAVWYHSNEHDVEIFLAVHASDKGKTVNSKTITPPNAMCDGRPIQIKFEIARKRYKLLVQKGLTTTKLIVKQGATQSEETKVFFGYIPSSYATNEFYKQFIRDDIGRSGLDEPFIGCLNKIEIKRKDSSTNEAADVDDIASSHEDVRQTCPYY